MRKPIVLPSIVFVSLFLLCGKCDKSNGMESCKNLPGIKWKYESQGFDKDKALELVTKLNAAAEVDGTQSEQLAAKGSFDVKVESMLAKAIKENSTFGQDVSDSFWEQDIRFKQTLCFMQGLLNRKDLKDEERKTVMARIDKTVEAYNNYILGVDQKKSLK